MICEKIVRIAHVVSVETSNYFLNNLFDFSDHRKVQYFIITLGKEGAFTQEMRERGVEVIQIPAGNVKEKIRAVWKIKQVIHAKEIDLVHTHLFIPSLIGVRAAVMAGVKALTTRHHSDALYQIGSRVKRFIWLRLESYVNRKVNHLIAPSQMVYDILVKKEKVPATKVSLIPYGQTTARFDAITSERVAASRKEHLMEGKLSMVFVARLFSRKGHTYLFRALTRLQNDFPDLMLYLVGTGPQQQELEEMAVKEGVDHRVRFLGWRNDALCIMAAADMIVHPSLEDALSSAVIEAVMLQKPVVASDISGVRDTLGNGQYGIIVPPADDEALEKGIRQLIANMVMAKRNAADGKRYLLEYMGAKRVADSYTELYIKLLTQSYA